jgi:hypothetical protein
MHPSSFLLRSLGFAAAVSAAVVFFACAGSEDDAAPGSNADALTCSAPLAGRLTKAARSVDGRKSQHRCYAYVKQHLRAAGVSTTPVDSEGFGASAFQFAVWAKGHPDELSQMGFSPLAKVDLNELPAGAIIVWPRGMCGYNKTHGHIEIVVDDNSSRACSDFCGSIKKTCGTPDVFVPNGCGPDDVTAAAVDASADPAVPADPFGGDDDDDAGADAGDP